MPFLDRPAAAAAAGVADQAHAEDGLVCLVERLLAMDPPETVVPPTTKISMGDLYVETMTRRTSVAPPLRRQYVARA